MSTPGNPKGQTGGRRRRHAGKASPSLGSPVAFLGRRTLTLSGTAVGRKAIDRGAGEPVVAADGTVRPTGSP